MKVLAIDIGSSSVKCAILTGAARPKVGRHPFQTDYDGPRVEVDPKVIETAVIKSIRALGTAAKRVDLIVSTTMAPSWLAMDKRGRPVTPIVTHQDRRAIEAAQQIEQRVGRARHLKLAGNRPFPGGISSTTWRWFAKHQPGILRRADLVGHLSTWLARRLCDARVTDPSNAGFMGVYRTLTLEGWSEELIHGAGVSAKLLPEVRQADSIAGRVTRTAAHDFGLAEGTPLLVGCMDGSSAMLAADPKVGRLLNVSGSTDVLALLVDQPKPHEHLLTRPLGVGRQWLAVATLAAAGSAVQWARRTFFADLSEKAFYRTLGDAGRGDPSAIRFDPTLAGSRTSMDEPTATIAGLTLGSTREEMLRALCNGLADSSEQRLALLLERYGPIDRSVIVTGGLQSALAGVLHRGWSSHGRWRFREIDHATLTGAWRLAERFADRAER